MRTEEGLQSNWLPLYMVFLCVFFLLANFKDEGLYYSISLNRLLVGIDGGAVLE